MDTVLQISIDWLLIGRCFGAMVWGVLWALFLQFHRLGRFMADERTWITVVIGVGVDLVIGIGTVWWEMWLVVVCSSIGIIARSLINESSRDKLPSGYKVLWGLEEIIALSRELIEQLEALIETEDAGRVVRVSRAVRMAHLISRRARDARQGEYNGK